MHDDPQFVHGHPNGIADATRRLRGVKKDSWPFRAEKRVRDEMAA